jgi:hypothetical protein
MNRCLSYDLRCEVANSSTEAENNTGRREDQAGERRELATYLNKGWQITKELRSGKMLIAKA